MRQNNYLPEKISIKKCVEACPGIITLLQMDGLPCI